MRNVLPAAAEGFARDTSAYVRGRPDFPPAALGWLQHDLGLGRGKTAIDLKSDRNKATGDLENAVKEWYAANKPGPGARGLDPLRKVLWWRDAMAKVPIEEAAKTGTQKQEIAITEMQWKFNVITMVPKSYRPRQSEQYPLVVTVVDKEADAKLMDRHYGDLANTHIVIALRDEEVKSPAHFFFALAWASLTHRIDRDRVTLDGIGRGSKWIDDVAPQLALQFNGAVFRAPLKTHPSVANLGHFP